MGSCWALPVLFRKSLDRLVQEVFHIFSQKASKCGTASVCRNEIEALQGAYDRSVVPHYLSGIRYTCCYHLIRYPPSYTKVCESQAHKGILPRP